MRPAEHEAAAGPGSALGAGREEPELITAARAARILDVVDSHIYWLANTGRLTSHPADRARGAARYLDRAEVEQLAAERSAWVSYATAAEIAGLSPTTIATAVRNGQLEQRADITQQRPSISRASVIAWAPQHRAHLAELERARSERARPQLDPAHVWLSTSTAAAVLGVSRSRVGQWVQEGHIPYSRVGNRLWFRRDHVEQRAAARALSGRQASSLEDP